MSRAQLGAGIVLLCLSMLLRNWGRVNFRLPVFQRPLAFQNRQFSILLSMVWQGMLVIGLLMVSLVKYWMGLVAVVICFFILSPLLVFFLEKLLGYDKLKLPPNGLR